MFIFIVLLIRLISLYEEDCVLRGMKIVKNFLMN